MRFLREISGDEDVLREFRELARVSMNDYT